MKFEEFSATSLNRMAETALREKLYNKYHNIAEDLTDIAKIGGTSLVIGVSELNEEIVRWLCGLGFRFESFYSIKNFSAKWQATLRPVPISLNSGASFLHLSHANEQRGWNLHPSGRFAGFGVSPFIGSSLSTSWLNDGIEPKSPLV